MSSETFVPHASCTVASGDCFVASQCLRKCQACLPGYEANASLTIALRLLGDISEYTLMFRSVTGFVDGSSIDAAIKEARQLIQRHKP